VSLQEWSHYTLNGADDVRVTTVAGNHLWPIAEPTAKAAWLHELAAVLKETLL
jgi:hypothetical protein